MRHSIAAFVGLAIAAAPAAATWDIVRQSAPAAGIPPVGPNIDYRVPLPTVIPDPNRPTAATLPAPVDDAPAEFPNQPPTGVEQSTASQAPMATDPGLAEGVRPVVLHGTGRTSVVFTSRTSPLLPAPFAMDRPSRGFSAVPAPRRSAPPDATFARQVAFDSGPASAADSPDGIAAGASVAPIERLPTAETLVTDDLPPARGEALIAVLTYGVIPAATLTLLATLIALMRRRS